MRVLLLGSGGREHAFAWKIAQSSRLEKLFIAPGNAGTESIGENVALNPLDFDAIADFVVRHRIQLVVPCAEEPLVKGIYDFFAMHPLLHQVMLAGPSHNGALLEGSKDFAKDFMQRHQIPTAAYKTFTATERAQAEAYLLQHSLPIVLKADGLAAGKGVIICSTHQEAHEHLNALFDGKFGVAGKKVVIESFLKGIEFSVFVLTDTQTHRILPTAKDYKRIGEGDTGLNTGGMGAIAPVPFVDKELMYKVEKKIIEPTLKGLQKEKIIYQGFIYFGLIKVGNEPYVIEYNCRMGDPETQAVFPLLHFDLLEALVATCTLNLHKIDWQISHLHAATLVLAAEGYPEAYQTNQAITFDAPNANTLLFMAGVKKENQQHYTNGGRVLALTATAPTLAQAVETVYRQQNNIHFSNKYFRRDIGKDVLHS
ncbi:MAG: phosphoribosylamine--glycine ligase [Chitinophagales bacterium]|nr:phosphoribosylamine--glycine ligase [Bacteroidota bacterium]MCB9043722.1 phosphoribosylamine--glycine ligase [Chitinophagales bacterium]